METSTNVLFKRAQGIGPLPRVRFNSMVERKQLLDELLKEVGRKCYIGRDKVGAIVDHATAREKVNEIADNLHVSQITVRRYWQLAGAILGEMRGDPEGSLILTARRKHAIKRNQRKPFLVNEREHLWITQKVLEVNSVLHPDKIRNIVEADLTGMSKSHAKEFAGVSIEPINKYRRVMNKLRNEVLVSRHNGIVLLPLLGADAQNLEEKCMARCQERRPLDTKWTKDLIVEKLISRSDNRSKITKMRVRTIVGSILSGKGSSEAARSAGVTVSTVCTYRERIRELVRADPDKDLSLTAVTTRAIQSVFR